MATFDASALAGKRALVTGAGGVLGTAIARRLGLAGATIIVTDMRTTNVEATVQSLRGEGIQARTDALDITDEAQWERVVATAEREGGLDIVVNNAGIEIVVPLAEMSVADFRRLVDINLTGTFLGIKHGMRSMRPGGASGRGGAIVNISSAAGLSGSPLLAAYSASKAGVALLSRSAALECGQMGYGIRVNSVHPGLVESRMGDRTVDALVELGAAPNREAIMAMMLAGQPLGLGRPDDVAQAVLFLASDAARWMTGVELPVDGGFTAH